MKKVIQYLFRLLLLLAVLVSLSILSYQLSSVTNSLLLYLPLVLGIVLIHWFGPKVVPVIFINGLTTFLFWGVSILSIRISILTTHEAAVALASWFLYTQIGKEKGFLPLTNTRHFLRFAFLAIIIPVSVNSIYVYHYGFIKGDIIQVGQYWLSDFITVFPIATFLLYFILPSTDQNGWALKIKKFNLARRTYIELLLISMVFIALSLLFPFDKYWFIYGIGATLFALRRGFEAAIILNLIIFFLNYFLPLFDFASSLLITQGSTQYSNVHLGMSTMMFVTSLVGRVVSDLNETKINLKNQMDKVEIINTALEQKNQELDRFVYSVSHDLSAPLKSIRGLVAISRIDPHQSAMYFEKIEKSANRLEEFIDEVLDYSRANRKTIQLEVIELRKFINDINDKFEFLEWYEKIDFNFKLQITSITSDQFLLRVILSNLLSNAIKYQKKFDEHLPTIAIRSYSQKEWFVIEIEDNGEGVKEEYQGKLFNMFYRGTASSKGSGLGLYIAKEATERLGGSLTMTSTWGVGTIFTIRLPADTVIK